MRNGAVWCGPSWAGLGGMRKVGYLQVAGVEIRQRHLEAEGMGDRVKWAPYYCNRVAFYWPWQAERSGAHAERLPTADVGDRGAT